MAVTAAEIRAILTLQDQLSGQLSKVQGELHKLGASAAASGNAARAAGPSWASMSTAIAAGTVAANAFMGAAKGVVSILSSAGSAATDFGDSIAATRSKLSTAEWDQYGAALEKNALRLGKDYPLAASDAAKAQDLLISKGLTAKQVLDGGADSVVRLASATGTDLMTATSITAAAMDTFNVDAADMNRVTNLITGTMIRAGVSGTDYGFAIKAAGAVIKLAGGDIDDASLAIAAMAKAGIEGSDAGTSLKTMYSNLQPTTKAQIATMLELGLITKDGANAFYDASGKVKSYDDIGRILAKSLEGLTEQQQQMALETMFGSDAIRAAAVAAKYGRGEYGELKKELASVDADEVAKKRMDSLAGSLKQFGGSAETVGIVLMGKLGPGMKTLVDTGTELLNSFLDKLESSEAAAFFDNLAKNAKSVEDGLYATGQAISEFGDAIKDVPIIGAPLNAFLQTAGSGLTGLAAIMRGDAKGAAEAFGNAIGTAGSKVGELAALVQPAIDKAIEVGNTVKAAADKAGEMGAWQSLGEAFKNIADSGTIMRDRLAEINDSLGKSTTAAGVVATPVQLLAAAIRGAALGFQLATLQMQGWIDTAGSYLNVGINLVSGLNSLGLAMQRLARGDIDGMRNSIVDAREAFGRVTTAAEEARTRGVERFGESGRIMAQIFGQGVAEVPAVTEANLSRATEITDVSSREIARLLGAGMQDAVVAVETQAPAATAAVETMGQGMVSGIEAAAPEMAAAAESAASGAVAAVEGQAGPANAAGASVGSNLGAGMVDGILGWLGRVRAAAAEMVSSAIGAGEVEGEIRSPSERTKETGRMLAAGVAEGIKELSPEVQARMRDLIDAAASYMPVAGEIKRVEGEIAAIRQRGQSDALFRAKEMITIDSEALRLKKEMAVAEKGMLPVRQALARAAREVESIERGSLGDRQAVIGMDGERKKIRLQIIDLERQLIGLDSDSKKAEKIQEQIDKLQDQDRLLSLEAERIELTNSVAATGARIRREALDDQIRSQENALTPLREHIALLGAEQAVFQALEAIVDNALKNEIAERERLIAVFRAEAEPIRARIEAGLAYVDQLEAEGVLTNEQADKLREVGKNLDVATRGTAALGNAAEASAPQIDAATKKAEEMAAAGAKIAGSYDRAVGKVKELGETIGKLDTPFKELGATPKARARAMGGPVVPNDLYLVGERGPEMFVPDSAGTILPADATAALLDGSSGGSTGRGASGGGGREIHVHMEGAQIYGMSDFESAVQRAVGRGLKRGQFGG